MSGNDDLKALGANSAYGIVSMHTHSPDEGLLERFLRPSPIVHAKPEVRAQEDNPFGNGLEVSVGLFINIDVQEFTCLCPKTGQPDYGSIVIGYTPESWCVESKSLKLYLMSFRNFGSFHEAVVTRIGDALVQLLSPRSLHVTGKFNPRGGIAFLPTYTYSRVDYGKA